MNSDDQKGNSLLKRRKLDRWEQDQIWQAQDYWDRTIRMSIYVLIAIVIGLSVWASLPERSPRTYSIKLNCSICVPTTPTSSITKSLRSRRGKNITNSTKAASDYPLVR